MTKGLSFCSTTVGKKYIMGLSALVWTGFVFAHMAGNFLMFFSADAYNKYGHALTSGNLIYAIEGILILALATHVALAINLTLSNRAARPVKYAVPSSGSKAPSTPSTMMAVQGSVVLVFIINHLLMFKFGSYYETTVDGVVMRDLYKLVVELFSIPAYVIGYVVSLILLGFHLSHGVGSIFQSFGLMHSGYQKKIKALSLIYAVVVAGGFISQPIFVFLFARQ